MNARSRALLEELRSLPLKEQEAVVAELYEGTAGEVVAEAWDPAWAAELERRVQASRAGLTKPVSQAEARARVEEALRARR
jgi:putative addiction module component (TIGR02574 family)